MRRICARRTQYKGTAYTINKVETRQSMMRRILLTNTMMITTRVNRLCVSCHTPSRVKTGFDQDSRRCTSAAAPLREEYSSRGPDQPFRRAEK
ncbi:hypothetical protein QVD17_32665 [Tagetes erecta]|uniref:Uncharacterized protein n=1 Tax=Tagetes erecta TaxID=13708 RepID=A0AAD8JYL7_TARER|nr:hypothetical protein QVD17_32665 [Tagetes erecta]